MEDNAQVAMLSVSVIEEIAGMKLADITDLELEL